MLDSIMVPRVAVTSRAVQTVPVTVAPRTVVADLTTVRSVEHREAVTAFRIKAGLAAAGPVHSVRPVEVVGTRAVPSLERGRRTRRGAAAAVRTMSVQ